ncbi:MAG: PAS domain S-box protein [Deltaproteobacteria bacterium]|nr:PAS domain S-box protein [Deltaproteobacteria bacterium]
MAKKPTYEELEQELDEEVVKRKQAEKALRESEEKFKLLYEKAPIGYQSLDEHGHFLEVNQAWLDTLGYTREEVIGKSFGDLLHPDWVDHFKQNFPRFKAIGEIPDVEFEMVKKDRSLIMVNINGKIGRDEKGNFKQTHCILHDITSQKKSEEALRESEEKFRNFAEQSIVGIYLISDDVFKYVNPKFSEMFGYSVDECLNNMHFPQLVHPEDLVTVQKQVGRRLSEETKVVRYSFRGIKKNGETIHVDIFGSSMVLKGKTVATGSLLDITERKRAEEALRESEDLHKEAQRVAHIGHWELYPEIGTPVWSDEIFRIFALNPQESEPSFTDHETHLHPDDWPLLKKVVTLASSEGTPFNIIFRIVQPDDEIRWMHAIGTTTKDEKGKVTKLFGTAQNITDLKRAEEERERLINELQETLAEVKTLSGMLPICSNCKKIRDDKGYWNQIESYIGKHSEAKFSHGICPACAKKLYPEFDLYPETK